ncbi:arginine N-succinyltransferase [Vibrio viridaestus]|uniref:Arginine N-succinyltransferase n=1 Tax=Vibrio viridaestus TaxID=2487322 RepID=A0A3N9TCC3_9VIBR|nr:arginine N-succinyltransferase [Vibrio viridaestus]RQW61811.1 arginine N-succinyltransferase [Vibrio viridaestus]
MIILRPARLSDINQVERLADESGTLVCTLPAMRELLVKKIERSNLSFEQDVLSPGEEFYFFVLEEIDTGQILGTGAINALAGFREPFYSFRNDTMIHSSRELNVHSRIHALKLNHDLSDHSQLSTFYVVPSLKETLYPSLVTLGRLLFMTISPERFTNEWIAVLPGIADGNGRAPFWEHVGRKFFDIDYSQVEYYHGTLEKTFIAELMPHYPLYVPLIEEEAQSVMGQVHPDAELQCNLLSDAGFEPDKYIEIFDGGPILTSPRSNIFAGDYVKQAIVTHKITDNPTVACLVAYFAEDGFRAFITEASFEAEKIYISVDVMKTFSIKEGEQVWFIAL